MHLHLVHVTKNFPYRLLQSQHLENLVLESCMIDDDVSSSSSSSYRNHPVQSFSHSEVAVVGLNCKQLENAWVFIEIVTMLSNVKDLQLSVGSMKLLRSNPDLVDHLPTFSYLKHLKLDICDHYTDVGVVARLLQCSPVLQSLRLKFVVNTTDTSIIEGRKSIHPGQFFCTSVRGCLKLIDVVDFYGSKNQIELLTILLANAKVLEKINVCLHEFVKNPSALGNELLHLPRLSNHCVFDVHIPPPTLCDQLVFELFSNCLK